MAMTTDKGAGTGVATMVLAATATKINRGILTYDNNEASEDMGAMSGSTRSAKNTDSIIGNERYRNGNSNGGNKVEVAWGHSIGSNNGGVDGGTHGIGGNDGNTTEKVEGGMIAEGLWQQRRS